MSLKTKKKPEKQDSIKVQVRREKVLERRMAGMTIRQIAKELRVNTRTIDRDCVENKKLMSKVATIKTTQQLFGEITTKKDMRTRRFWAIILNQNSSNRERISSLNSLRSEDKDHVDNCQKLGILPTIPVSVEQIVNVQQNKWEQTNIVNMLMKIEKAEEEVERKKVKVAT